MTAVARRLAWALTGAGVLAQMAFPFTGGGTDALTITVVVLLAAGVLAHAAASRGVACAVLVLAVAGGGSLVAEAVGVATGFPFGSYDYATSLGPGIAGVPLIVPLAWVMIAYPCLLASRRLVGPRRWAVAPVAAWTMTSWDVFLDPQMVDAGHWSWRHPTPSLPGVADVPLTNYAGWLAVSLVLGFVLDRLLPAGRPGRSDLLPHALLLWTWASSILAHAAFFGRPPVALVGGLLMGVVAVPLATSVVRGRPG